MPRIPRVEGNVDSAEVARELMAAEAKHSGLVAQAADAIVVSVLTKRGLTIEKVNSAACELVGYTRDELVGRYLADLVTPEDLANNPFRSQVLTASTTVRNERVLLRKDGTTVAVETISSLLDDGRVQSIFRDITERNLAEEAVRESEKRLRAFWEFASDAIAISDPDAIVLVANPAYCTLYGYSPEEVIGHSFAIIFPPEVREWACEEYKRTFADPQIPPTVEATIQRKDGTQRIVEVRYNFTEMGGQRTAMISMIRDITERKQAEQSLLQSERELNDFFENSVVGLHWVGPDGTILRVNQAELNLLGYTREEYVGHKITEFHVDQPVIEDILRRLSEGETLNNCDARLRCKDGTIKHVLISCNVLWDADGSFQHSRCFTRDITERKLAEEALRRSEELFAQAFRASPDAFIITRLSDDVLIDVNNSFTDMTGHSREEAVGRPVGDMNIWADLGDRERMITLIRAEGSISNFETRYTKKSGEVGFGLMSAELAQIGDEPCMLAICRDITERKRVEVALEETLALVSATLESAADGILVTNDTGGITNSNKRFKEMWGLPADVLAANDDGLALRFVLGQLRDPEAFLLKAQDLRNQPGTDSFDIMEFNDGRTFERYSKPQQVGDHSVGRVWSFRDVTERNRASEALKESEARYRTVIEQASDGIFLADVEGNLISVNVTGCEMLGYEPDEMLRQTVKDFVELADPQTAQARLQDLAAGKTVRAEHRMYRKDGTTFPAEISSKFLPGGVYQAFVRDITERKHAAQSLVASEEKFRAIFDATLDAIFIIDNEGRFVDVNSAATNLIGIQRDELLSLSYESFEEQARGKSTLEDLWGGLLQHGGADGEISFVTVEGQTKHVEYHGKLNFIPGFHVATVHDVTESRLAEHKLRESEERFRQAFDYAGVGMSLVSLEGRFIQVNPSLCAIYGYSAAELLTKTFQELTHPDDLEEDLRCVRQLLEGQIKSYHLEKRYFRKDGRIVWVALSVALVSDPKGKPLYFVSQVEDITLRKRAEEALKKSKSELELRVVARTAELHASNNQLQHELTERVRAEKALQQSEEQFRAIFEHAPVMIGSFTEDGRCNLWNAEGERQLGYTTEEMLAYGDPLSIFYPDQDVRDGVIESIVLTDNTFREFGVRASNDTTRHQMWANFALPNKDVISIGYDITERKLAEERLRKSEELYRALARNLPNGAVLMFDHDLRYQLAEGVNLTSLNYSPQSIIGKTIWEVLPPDRCEVLVPYYQAALAGQESIIDIESGNPSRIYLVHFVPVKDEHGATFAGMAVSLDITEQRRSAEEAQWAQESAEQANRAKSEFLSRMSHELRTPLNSIIGFSQLLEVSNLPAKQSKYVNYVLKAGEHLLALINEVLDIASVEAGRSNLSMEPVEVRATLQECLDLVEPLTAQRKVGIDTGNSLEQSWHVLADRQRLRQVLLNIIANAIKYNRDGGSVTVSCEVVEERLRIQVSDTGPGLSEDKLAKLFIPFERLGAELTEVEGSGLGLALSRNLVEAMRGSMGVVSTVGLGSAFWVDLPIAESPMQQIDKLQTGPIMNDGQPLKGRTILYVEDNLSNVRLMEGILESTSGVRLITAMQGGLAIEIARQEQPDLILLDLHLPDINGDEVLRSLQADPRTSAIPVVMVSADATTHQIERLHDAGAREYLTKPLSIKRLITVLDEVFNETT